VKIHAFGSQPHYRDHIHAVHRHLPGGLRGEWLASARDARDLPETDLVMVAGYIDIAHAMGHKVIYVEHGAGQSYVGNRAAEHYHGSEHPGNVVAYLSPRQEVADSWQRPALAVGAPVCDDYPLVTGNVRPVATISFHWDCHAVPETRSALDHYLLGLGRAVRLLREEGYTVLGHHHPKDRRLPRIWDKLQVQQADIGQVRALTDLFIADNTSVSYEMSYLRRRTITMNAPWYRRDVHHGLRFWDAAPGIQVDTIEELEAAIRRGGSVDTEAAKAAYGRWCSDGDDGLRAAAWLTAVAPEL